ncbi:head protein [Hyalangium rubrum]|uniref:Head protein n=1 Tax=Hyalangium rubrum TaxID=3103134 RepID=A0ABU5HEH6_9BACT|nr:head protein [Hyalangium sp. s54d21]MDY7231761.1 head protein [Hyalangium sp. s54d21]
MSITELCLEVEGLLGRFREDSSSPKEQKLLLVAIDALNFISATGQSHEFEDYLKRVETDAPPLVIASFDTREEAETWLENHPHPPRIANVLIGGEYYSAMCSRERNDRRLVRTQTLEYYLAAMIRDGIPPSVATFNTQEEATAWVHGQPEPPRQVFIHIAGAAYLVVYHDKVNLRAIYPLSRAAKNVNWD